jgi:hypothetical protein
MIQIQPPADHFQKTAGTGGAFIVHLKIPDPAPLYGDKFAVLAAYVDNGPRVGAEKFRPPGVGAYFGDHPMGPGNFFPAVSRGGQKNRTEPAIVRQQVVQNLPAAFLHIPACGTPGQSQYASVIQKGAFTKGGTAVDPGQRPAPEIPGHD